MSPRIVLITGANSGVGLATVKVLTSASTNYHVIIASRTLAKAQNAKSEVEAENPSSGSRLSTVQLDVTDINSINQANETVQKDFGHLDALINNAAVGPVDADTATKYRNTMEANVIGPAVVAETFRPLLFRSSNPYSIFVSSGAGSFGLAVARLSGQREKIQGPKNGEAYPVSKAALNMVALQEHATFAEKGLKVFAMCPGFVVSNLRGPSEELRTGWGKAGPASESGNTLFSILEGKRDGDVGKLVHKDGVHAW